VTSPDAGPAGAARIAPASVGQRVLWALQHYRGGDGALNVPVLLRIRERVDADRLQRAVDSLAARHEALRTTFRRSRHELELVVYPPRPVPLTIVDLAAAADRDAAAARAITEETRSAIDPGEWPMRATMWALGPEDHIVCLNIHHLVTDDSSSAIIVRDLAALYGGAGESAGLPPVHWQYSEFTSWQRAELTGDARDRHLRYWIAHLEGARSPALPAAAATGAGQRSSTRTARTSMETELIEALRLLARKQRATFFTVLLAAFAAGLAAMTGSADLTITSLFSQRTRRELVNTVGYFVAPLVLRVRVPEQASFAEFLESARATVLGAMEHQALPYHLLPPHVVPPGALRPDDLVFQVMSDPVAGGPFEVLHRPETDGTGRTFELEIVVRPWEGQWTATAFYAADRFPRPWIDELLGAFVAAARAMAADPRAPAQPVPLSRRRDSGSDPRPVP
jgi:condensation domain-containing protein